jgi:hypothetical protein
MPARKPITVLIFGDIVGRAGRNAVKEVLPKWRKKYSPHLVIANAENLAHGSGVTPATLEESRQSGIDIFTSGNHIFKRKDAIPLLTQREPILLRPANYPPDTPGVGHRLLAVGTLNILVINLIGRVFFAEDFEDPFREFERILKQYRNQKINAIIVDAHTEATSEVSALGWYVDGRATVLYGTHTHVPTADAKVLPQGTAYISDVGMTGLRDTVLGVDKDIIIKRFITQTPVGFIISDTGPAVVNALVVNLNPNTGLAIDAILVQDEVNV